MYNTDFEDLMEQCLGDCHQGSSGSWGCDARKPEFFMSPFAFLAPGVVVPQKKPSRPAVWVKSLNLPEMFTHKDVSVKVEGDVAHITAARTFGDEEAGGTDTIQATRKVDIPADVNPDTVKSVWRKGRLFLRGDWRKQEKAAEKTEEKSGEKTEIPVETEISKDVPINDAETERNDTETTEEKMEEEEKEEEREETSENQPDILRENSETNKPEHMTTEDKREETDVVEEKVDETAAVEEKREEERRPLDLRLELPSISPENITVKLVDDRLIVEAVQKDEKQGHSMIHHVRRVITLPHYIDIDQIKSSVTDDGMLKIYAPVQKTREEPRQIMVEMQQ